MVVFDNYSFYIMTAKQIIDRYVCDEITPIKGNIEQKNPYDDNAPLM